MSRWSSLARRIVAALALVVAGCGATLPTEPTPMRISVTSLATTNENRPLHCMVRAVEPEVAMVEDYDQAAVMIFTGDETLLARDVIFPGRPFELDVTIDPTQAIAVYFFFTNPADGWVVPVPAPLPARLSIELGANEVQSWSPRVTEGDAEGSEAGELVLPPIGGAPRGGAAPALPEMPEVPETPTAPALPGRSR